MKIREAAMEWPITTGELRKLLDIPEHKLNNLIRMGRLKVSLVCGVARGFQMMLSEPRSCWEKTQYKFATFCAQSVQRWLNDHRRCGLARMRD